MYTLRLLEHHHTCPSKELEIVYQGFVRLTLTQGLIKLHFALRTIGSSASQLEGWIDSPSLTLPLTLIVESSHQ
jgi:hypothetical protein